MNKASVISKGGTTENLAPPQLPQSWSPSAVRKMNSEMHAKRVNLNLCYLGEQQAIGEFVTLPLKTIEFVWFLSKFVTMLL